VGYIHEFLNQSFPSETVRFREIIENSRRVIGDDNERPLTSPGGSLSGDEASSISESESDGCDWECDSETEGNTFINAMRYNTNCNITRSSASREPEWGHILSTLTAPSRSTISSIVAEVAG
jgi:hypothetical protein